MADSIFMHFRFWALVLGSLAAPCAIYLFLLFKRKISRVSVVLFGIVLVVLSSIDVFLLQAFESSARVTASLADDAVFASELSVALYLLPLFFAGVGIHLVAHVLVTHLIDAERRYDSAGRPHRHDEAPPSVPDQDTVATWR